MESKLNLVNNPVIFARKAKTCYIGALHKNGMTSWWIFIESEGKFRWNYHHKQFNSIEIVEFDLTPEEIKYAFASKFDNRITLSKQIKDILIDS